MEFDFKIRDVGTSSAQAINPDLVAQTHEAPPARKNQKEFDQFNSIDEEKHITSADTVFVGSSTFAWWNSLEEDFKEENAINRAIGGTTIPDINDNLHDLVLKYQPHNVVVYSGINDLARGRQPDQVEQDVEKLERNIHSRMPNAELYFLAPSESPKNKDLKEKYREAGKLIRNYLEGRSHCHFVDTPTVMHNSEGALRTELYLQDDMHPNKRGYDEVLRPLIKDALHPTTRYGGISTRPPWI